MSLTFEPVTESCDVCNREAGAYQNVAVLEDDRVVCAGCLFDEYETDQLERFVKLCISENEYTTYETGYSVDATIGVFRVEFDVDRNTEALTQVAVDDFKVKGHYTRLRGSGDVFLEEPARVETDITTDSHADYINEQRQEDAMSGRR